MNGAFNGAFVRFCAAILAVFLLRAQFVYGAPAPTEFGVADDLTVYGTDGTVPDPDAEIKGFTVFGSTNLLTHVSTAPGNVLINGALQVNNLYAVGASTFSGSVYVIGYTSATKYYGDGSSLTGLTGLADNLGNHIAVQDLNLAGFGIVGAGAVTASSYTATGVGFAGAQYYLAPNVIISSESAPSLGGGVRVSTNMYVVGFASATKYYGDGSSLTGLGALADNLGDHTATQDLKMGGYQITNAGPVTASSFTASGIGIGAAQLNLAPNVGLSSASAANYGGVYVSSNLYVNGKLYGDGSTLSGLGGTLSGGQTPKFPYWTSGNTLGNSSLSQDAGGLTVMASTFTVQGAGGIAASRQLFAPNVEISSETSPALGAGVRVSTNMYIVGFASATRFYGDGSALTGLAALADNLGNHIATQNLNMAGLNIGNVNFLTASSAAFTNGVTASSFTATGAGFRGAQYYLAPNVIISSESAPSLGAGLNVSSNVYVVGFASATKFYGDGSALTGISGNDNLGNHTATQDLKLAGYNISGAGSVTASSYTAEGIGFSGAQLNLAPNVGLSSASAANYGGVYVSSNLYVNGKLYGDGSTLSGLGGTLSGGQAPKVAYWTASNSLGNASLSQDAGGLTVQEATFTVQGAGGIYASRHQFAPNVEISSETSPALGGGVSVSTNMYIVGFASATRFYGDGSALTGIGGNDNLGNHTATQNLNLAGFDIVNASSISVAASKPGLTVSTHLFVMNGNVGISTSNPAGRLTVGSGQVMVPDGTQSAPAYSFGSSHNSGMYLSPGNPNIEFAANGSRVFLINANGQVNVPSGSAAVPSISDVANQNSGLIINNRLVGISVDSVERVRFAGTGSVGIGTTSPAYRLQVSSAAGEAGTMMAISTGTSDVIRMTGAGEIYANKYYGDGSALTGVSGTDNLGNHTATQNLNLAGFDIVNASSVTVAAGKPGLTISTNLFVMNGNLGVGTSSPFAKADIAGNELRLGPVAYPATYSVTNSGYLVIDKSGTAGDASLVLRDQGNARAEIGLITDNDIHFKTVTGTYGSETFTDRLLIRGTGEVDATGLLRSYATSGVAKIFAGNSDGATAGAALEMSYDFGSSLSRITSIERGNVYRDLVIEGNGLRFQTGAASLTEAMRITNAGAVGMGTTNPLARLDVVSTGTTSNQYAQIWRKSDGTIVASMTATGVMFATMPPGTGDNLGTHVAGQDLNMSGFNIVGAGSVTASSYTAVGAGFSGAQLALAGNVVISSEAQPAMGAGVRVSTNMYIVGFASATKFYGDGSGLTGLSGLGDNLGSHTATQDLKMQGLSIVNAASATFTQGVTASSFTASGIGISAAQLNLAAGVGISSASAADHGGVYVSSNLYVNGKLYGDGSGLTGMSGTLSGGQTPKFPYWTSGNTLGNSSLSQDAGGLTVMASTFTVQGAGGIAASRQLFAPNVEISSETSPALGAGVRVSTNMYIVGFASATKFYGDGSSLTGMGALADNLGNHTATQNLNLNGNAVVGVSSLTILSPTALASSLWVSTSVVTPHLYISTGGNVGLGTAAPASRLQVNLGGARNIGFNTDTSDGTGNARISAYNDSLTASLPLWLNGSTIAFQTNGSEKVRINTDGSVGIGTQMPLAKLDVVSTGTTSSQFAQVWRKSDGTVVASMTATGVLYATMPPGTGDNLGTHVAGQDLNMSGFNIINLSSISVAASTPGLTVSSNLYVVNGYAGIGTQSPTAPLHVAKEFPVATDSVVEKLDFGNLTNRKISFGLTSGALTYIQPSQSADETQYRDLALVPKGANVVVGSGSANYRLVVSSGAGESGTLLAVSTGGVSVVRMTGAGEVYANKFYGDGSGLTGMSGALSGGQTPKFPYWTSGNTLGNSSLSQDAGGLTVMASTLTVQGPGGIAASRQLFAPNVEISSETSPALGAGVRVSTNMYIVGFASATRFYGDGSALTGIAGDNLGSHTATQNLKLNGNWVSNDGDNEGVFVNTGGDVGIGTASPGARLDVNNNIRATGWTPTGSGTGVGIELMYITPNNAGSILAYDRGGGVWKTLDYYGSRHRFYTGQDSAIRAVLTENGNFGLGTQSPAYRLHVSSVAGEAGTLMAVSTGATNVFWVDGAAAHAIKFSGDGSGLTNLNVPGDNLGSHVATQDLNLANFNVANANFLTASSAAFANGVTASSFTAASAAGIGAAQVKFAPAVWMSSASAVQYGGVFVSTHLFTSANIYAGNITASKFYGDGSGLTNLSARNYVPVTVPAAVNDYMEIGNFDISNGGHNLYVAVTVSDPGFIVAKQYILPLSYNMTSGLWRDAIPAANTGAYGGNDFALEVRVNNTTAYLRIRRTGGAAAGTALVSMEQVGSTADTFTPTGGSGASAFTAYLAVTALTQTAGNVGIGTINPGSKLEVAGDATLSGSMRVLSLGASQGIRDSGAQDLTLFTSAVSPGPVVVTPGGAESARFTPDNKLGIGTVSPAYRLQVSSAAGFAGTLMAVSTGTSDVVRLTGAGEVYANKFYGDGSALTGLGGNDNLGNHTATQNLNLAGYNILNVSTVAALQDLLASRVVISSAAGFSGNMLMISTGASSGVIRMTGAGEIYATKFYGDGSALTGMAGALSGGQTPRMPYWTSGNTLGNSSISQDAGGLTVISSTFTVQGSAFSVGGSTLSVVNGNVGIGVQSPTNKLEVQDVGGMTFQVNTQAGYVSLKVNGVEVARMKP
jgi:hypothetical protein